MERKNVQRIAIIIVLILVIMIFNYFSLHIVEALNIEPVHPFYDFFWLTLANRELYAIFWIFHWAIAFFLLILLAVLVMTNFLDKWAKRDKVIKVEYKKEQEWKEAKIMECRIALRKHYDSLSSSHGVRLIGLVAGLWTLLNTVRPLKESQIVLWVTGAIVVVLFLFIYRSFFKFSLFSKYSSQVMWIEERELNFLLKIQDSLKRKNLLVLVDHATGKKIQGEMKKFESSYTRQKILGIPYDWFMSENQWKGFFLCLGLALGSTVILINLL